MIMLWDIHISLQSSVVACSAKILNESIISRESITVNKEDEVFGEGHRKSADVNYWLLGLLV